MACNACEARRRYMSADPEMYRDEDMRCDAHQQADIARKAGWDAAIERLRETGYHGAAESLMPVITQQCSHSVAIICEHCIHQLDRK